MEEKDKLLAQLELIRSRVSEDYYNGVQEAIDEYFSLKEDEQLLKFGSNPIEYYTSTKEPKGIVSSKKYIDLDETDVVELNSSQLYKMFSRQVVSAFKEGKFINMPKSWNLGMYYRPSGSITNSYTFSSGADMETIRANEKQSFTKSMQDRLDYLINSATSSTLYEYFNPKSPKEDTETPIFRLKVLGEDKELYGGKTADAFNDILNKMARGGRKVGVDQFVDTDFTPIEVVSYTPSGADQTNEMYKLGQQAALNRPSDYDLPNYLLKEYGEAKGKGDEFKKLFKAGFWDEISKTGSVMSRKDTGESALFGKLNIGIGNGTYDISVGDRQIQFNETNLPPGMRDYVGKVKFWRNITGESNPETDYLAGGVQAPL